VRKIAYEVIAWKYLAIKAMRAKTMDPLVTASRFPSEWSFLKSFSWATCCGSRGNANNVIARFRHRQSLILRLAGVRGKAIKPAQLQVIENVDVAVSVAEKI
jgi:hypothetical protein